MKKLTAIAALIACAAALSAEGSKDASAKAAAGKAVELRFLTFQVGVHPEAPWLKKTVDAFNKENEGRVRVVLDGVGSDQAAFEKLRIDAAAGTMPDLFMLKYGNEFNTLAASGAVLDLAPLVAADKAMSDKLQGSSSLAAYTHEGKLLGLPYNKAVVGVYYNKDLFRKAGVAEFPKTWKDFFAACEKLKASGVAPVALMTGENSWTSMLLLDFMIGSSPEGSAWLARGPEAQKFSDPAFVDAAAKLQEALKKYTTPDAIGASYGVAANNFLSGKAAMIANGPWMIGSFHDPKSAPEGFAASVGYAPAPGSIVIDMENIAYASGSSDPAKRKAAFAFLSYLARDDVYAEFLSLTGSAPVFKADLSKVSYDPIQMDFVKASASAKYRVGNFTTAVKPAVVDALSQYLPLLAFGQLSPEQFAQKLQAVSDAN